MKELKRIKKLMQYAFPRVRETYMYRKKLLGPDKVNASVDLYTLKKIKLEQERQRKAGNLDLEGHIESAGHQIGDPPETAYMHSALNSVSTLRNNMAQDAMAESTLETAYGDPTRVEQSQEDVVSRGEVVLSTAYGQMRSERGEHIDQFNDVQKSHNLTQDQFLSPKDREKIQIRD